MVIDLPKHGAAGENVPNLDEHPDPRATRLSSCPRPSGA
jgi:hypothetical protein